MSFADLDIKSTGKYLKIESGQPHDIRLLDDTPFERMVHGFGKDASECGGEHCMKCGGGSEKKQRFYVNVFDHGLHKVLIWEFGGGVAKQLKSIDNSLKEEQRSINDVDLKVDATGAMKDKKYLITPRMTSKPIPQGLVKHNLEVPF